jgi:hypothetical protein
VERALQGEELDGEGTAGSWKRSIGYRHQERSWTGLVSEGKRKINI